MAHQRKIFDPRQNGPARDPPPSFEFPNRQIEAKLQLRKHVNIILQGLQNDLRQHNMDKVTPDLDQNTITVMGYPPVNGFDQDTVLAIVKRRDPQATLLSFSELT